MSSDTPIILWLGSLAEQVKEFGQIRNYSGDIHRRLNEAAEQLSAKTAELEALRAELEACRRDAERLDVFNNLGEAYGFEDMHEGTRWVIDGPFINVRDAIDATVAAIKGGEPG